METRGRKFEAENCTRCEGVFKCSLLQHTCTTVTHLTGREAENQETVRKFAFCSLGQGFNSAQALFSVHSALKNKKNNSTAFWPSQWLACSPNDVQRVGTSGLQLCWLRRHRSGLLLCSAQQTSNFYLPNASAASCSLLHWLAP